MTIFAGMSSDSSKKKREIFFILFATILVVANVIGIVAGNGIANSSQNDNDSSASQSHVILKAACSNTRYPELCYSEIQNVLGAKNKIFKITSFMDVVKESLNLAFNAAEETIDNIKESFPNIPSELSTKGENFKSLTKRQKTGVQDCLEMTDMTLDQLQGTKDGLEKSPSEDLKILLSGGMTNQDSCIDGFSHDEADKNVRKILLADQLRVQHLVSNSLAMISNLTNTDMFNQRSTNFGSGSSGRNLVEETTNTYKLDSSGFPTWLSAADRRLLKAPSVTPNVVVAADGSGNYTTVSAAVAAAPEGSSSRYIIRIKAGVYRENVAVTKKKTNIMFVGDGRRNTIITGSRNVVDGSTTLSSATVIVVGARFLARDITFENTAGPSKHQAVAFRSSSDFSAFYRCNFLAYQDTLYVHSLRQFYVKCLIAGTVDFIFGNAAVVLQDCDIHARRPNSGQRNILTAQGRDDPNQNTGIVIQKCRIGATSDLLPVQSSFPTYLGRPWKEYSRTIVMQSTISNVINPAGWFEWKGNFALNTLYYAEYKNTGAGAGTANRVKWRGYRVLTNAADVIPFTVGRFLQGSRWLGATGFPFSLGL